MFSHSDAFKVGTADADHVCRNARLISLKVLDELLSKASSCRLVFCTVRPAINWTQDLRVDTEALAWDLKVESLHDIEVGHVE